MKSYVVAVLPNFSYSRFLGKQFHRQNRLVSSLLRTLVTRLTVYGISKPSEFQPLSTSDSCIRSRNVFNISASLSNNIVLGNSATALVASSILSVFGGIAKHTIVCIHCRYTAMAVMGMNASSGDA